MGVSSARCGTFVCSSPHSHTHTPTRYRKWSRPARLVVLPSTYQELLWGFNGIVCSHHVYVWCYMYYIALAINQKIFVAWQARRSSECEISPDAIWGSIPAAWLGPVIPHLESQGRFYCWSSDFSYVLCWCWSMEEWVSADVLVW